MSIGGRSQASAILWRMNILWVNEETIWDIVKNEVPDLLAIVKTISAKK